MFIKFNESILDYEDYVVNRHILINRIKFAVNNSLLELGMKKDNPDGSQIYRNEELNILVELEIDKLFDEIIV